ncbi:MAG TPA: hypothetical protein VJ765_01705, partial [Chitinophagaceae bacterium]|nr:hypothetical protein [Chitinophagaceae bacterium]
RAGLDFFFVILPDYPFVSRQKVQKSFWASKRKKKSRTIIHISIVCDSGQCWRMSLQLPSMMIDSIATL